jgi:beta-phosphoglucomutase-like phosphatase (HAD superfamily)
MQKKNNTCLIFDYDGVIANTDLGRFNLLKSILLSYNIRLPDHFTPMDLIGLSTKAFLVKNFPNLTYQEIDKIVARRHELFFLNLSEYCIPYEKMKKAIKYFSSKFDLALVTTNSVENVKAQLKYLEIIDYFKWIIGREKSESKGLIKTYALIPDILKKEISECIVIEDSDFNAARKEGFFCIRFDPQNLFIKGNENERVNSYPELIDIIDKYTTS